MSGYFDFGDFSVADFSPVAIQAPDVPLDEMTEKQLRSYLVDLRLKCKTEWFWQQQNGIVDKLRLIQLAEMYREAQSYLAEYDPALAARVDSPDYVPVLRMDGQIW